MLLENTVGCGAQIGGRFEELRAIRDRCRCELTDVPVGYCLDTCHLLAPATTYRATPGCARPSRQVEQRLGNRQREAHTRQRFEGAPRIAQWTGMRTSVKGYIGKAGFRRILAHPKLRSKPFILETPVDHDGDDRRNLENLKKLCPKSRTTTTRSS